MVHLDENSKSVTMSANIENPQQKEEAEEDMEEGEIMDDEEEQQQPKQEPQQQQQVPEKVATQPPPEQQTRTASPQPQQQATGTGKAGREFRGGSSWRKSFGGRGGGHFDQKQHFSPRGPPRYRDYDSRATPKSEEAMLDSWVRGVHRNKGVRSPISPLRTTTNVIGGGGGQTPPHEQPKPKIKSEEIQKDELEKQLTTVTSSSEGLIKSESANSAILQHPPMEDDKDYRMDTPPEEQQQDDGSRPACEKIEKDDEDDNDFRRHHSFGRVQDSKRRHRGSPSPGPRDEPMGDLVPPSASEESAFYGVDSGPSPKRHRPFYEEENVPMGEGGGYRRHGDHPFDQQPFDQHEFDQPGGGHHGDEHWGRGGFHHHRGGRGRGGHFGGGDTQWGQRWVHHDRPPPRIICKFFREGFCRDAEKCTYSHATADSHRQPVLCRFYQQGFCRRNLFCQNLHGEWPCKAFHKGECTKEQCMFSHEPLDDVSRPIMERMLEDERMGIADGQEQEPKFQGGFYQRRRMFHQMREQQFQQQNQQYQQGAGPPGDQQQQQFQHPHAYQGGHPPPQQEMMTPNGGGGGFGPAEMQHNTPYGHPHQQHPQQEMHLLPPNTSQPMEQPFGDSSGPAGLPPPGLVMPPMLGGGGPVQQQQPPPQQQTPGGPSSSFGFFNTPVSSAAAGGPPVGPSLLQNQPFPAQQMPPHSGFQQPPQVMGSTPPQPSFQQLQQQAQPPLGPHFPHQPSLLGPSSGGTTPSLSAMIQQHTPVKSEFGGSQQVLPTPPRPPSPIFPQSSQDKIASSSSSAFNINQMLEQITQQSVEQFPAMTATKTPKMEDPMDLLSLAVEESPASPPIFGSTGADSGDGTSADAKLIPVVREWRLYPVDIPVDSGGLPVNIDMKLIGQISSSNSDPRLRKLAEKQFDMVSKTLEKHQAAQSGAEMGSADVSSSEGEKKESVTAKKMLVADPRKARRKSREPKESKSSPKGPFSTTPSASSVSSSSVPGPFQIASNSSTSVEHQQQAPAPNMSEAELVDRQLRMQMAIQLGTPTTQQQQQQQMPPPGPPPPFGAGAPPPFGPGGPFQPPQQLPPSSGFGGPPVPVGPGPFFTAQQQQQPSPFVRYSPPFVGQPPANHPFGQPPHQQPFPSPAGPFSNPPPPLPAHQPPGGNVFQQQLGAHAFNVGVGRGTGPPTMGQPLSRSQSTTSSSTYHRPRTADHRPRSPLRRQRSDRDDHRGSRRSTREHSGTPSKAKEKPPSLLTMHIERPIEEKGNTMEKKKNLGKGSSVGGQTGGGGPFFGGKQDEGGGGGEGIGEYSGSGGRGAGTHHRGDGRPRRGGHGGGRRFGNQNRWSDAGDRRNFHGNDDHHNGKNHPQQQSREQQPDSTTPSAQSPSSGAGAADSQSAAATAIPPPHPISLREKRKNNEYESPLARLNAASSSAAAGSARH